jgi:hypothetical protein
MTFQFPTLWKILFDRFPRIQRISYCWTYSSADLYHTVLTLEYVIHRFLVSIKICASVVMVGLIRHHEWLALAVCRHWVLQSSFLVVVKKSFNYLTHSQMNMFFSESFSFSYLRSVIMFCGTDIARSKFNMKGIWFVKWFI